MSNLCVSLSKPSLKDDLDIASGLDCDIVEIRLDKLENKIDYTQLNNFKQNVMSTCMPDWEGGSFKGTERERIDTLINSLPFSNFVCIELATEKSLREELMSCAHEQNVKVIVSSHGFESTPTLDELLTLLQKQKKAGADIAKIAFMPRSFEDALNILLAQVKTDIDIPVIALSMGELGSFTRVVGPMLNGFLSFTFADDSQKTASGQIPLSKMQTIKKLIWSK